MVTPFRSTVREFLSDENGATAIEYSLIAGLIFLVIVGSVQAVMSGQNAQYTKISNAVNGAVNP